MYRYIFDLFLKFRKSTLQEKKDLWCTYICMKPSELFCFKDTTNFAAFF